MNAAPCSSDAPRCGANDPEHPGRICVREAGHPGMHNDEQFCWGDINAGLTPEEIADLDAVGPLPPHLERGLA